jgi:hypothetical protein
VTAEFRATSPAEAERTQSPIIKGGRMFNIRGSNAGVVDHCGVLRRSKISWSAISGTRMTVLIRASPEGCIRPHIELDPRLGWVDAMWIANTGRLWGIPDQ